MFSYTIYYAVYCSHLCCNCHKHSAVLVCGFHQLYVDPYNLYGIPDGIFYFIYAEVDCSWSNSPVKKISRLVIIFVLLSYSSAFFHWVQINTAQVRDWNHNYYDNTFTIHSCKPLVGVTWSLKPYFRVMRASILVMIYFTPRHYLFVTAALDAVVADDNDDEYRLSFFFLLFFFLFFSLFNNVSSQKYRQKKISLIC